MIALKFWREIIVLVLIAALTAAGWMIQHQGEKIDTQRDALKAAAGALRTAGEAIRSRDKAATDKAALEASDATETAQFYRGAARDAFKAGLASRPRCPGEPAGVRDDLRSLQAAGAFRSSDLPGESAKQGR